MGGPSASVRTAPAQLDHDDRRGGVGAAGLRARGRRRGRSAGSRAVTRCSCRGRPSALGSRDRRRVRVRVWGEDGSASGWSEPLEIEAGLLRPGDWSARVDHRRAGARREGRPYHLRLGFELPERDGARDRAGAPLRDLGRHPPGAPERPGRGRRGPRPGLDRLSEAAALPRPTTSPTSWRPAPTPSARSWPTAGGAGTSGSR